MSILKKIKGFILSSGVKLLLPAGDGSSGQVLKTDGNGNLTWVTTSGVPVDFGTEYQSSESDGADTTNGTSWSEKLTLTTPSLPSGDYIIQWSYQWKMSDSGTLFKGRVQINNAGDLTQHEQVPSFESNNHQVSGFAVRPLSGVNDIDLDYTSDSGGKTAEISKARLCIWRVS